MTLDEFQVQSGWLVVTPDSEGDARVKLTFRDSIPCRTGVVVKGDADMVGKAIVHEPKWWMVTLDDKAYAVVARQYVIAVVGEVGGGIETRKAKKKQLQTAGV